MNFGEVIKPGKFTALKQRGQEWLGKKSWSWFRLRLIWGQIEGFDLGCYTERYKFYPLIWPFRPESNAWYRLGWVDESHVPEGVGPEGMRRCWVLFMTTGAQDEFFEGLCK